MNLVYVLLIVSIFCSTYVSCIDGFEGGMDDSSRSEAANVPLAITLNCFGCKQLSFDSKIHIEAYSVPEHGSPNVKLTSISNPTDFPIDHDITFDDTDTADTIMISAQIISDGDKLEYISGTVFYDKTTKTPNPIILNLVDAKGEVLSDVLAMPLKKNRVTECQSIVCARKCRYGLAKNGNGCTICYCFDPCGMWWRKEGACPMDHKCRLDKQRNGVTCILENDLEIQNSFESMNLQQKASCSNLPVRGPCNGYEKRFYYKVATDTCKTFIYGGCRGNLNNFSTKEECELMCKI